MLRTILYISLLCFPMLLSAQQFKDFVKAGDKAFSQNKYYDALTYYGEALDIYDKPIEVHYRYAESARQFNAYTIAERAYGRVVGSEKVDSFYLAPYWLAMTKKQLGKYEEAIPLYEKYLANPGMYRDHVETAKKHIQDCNWAVKQLENSDETIKITQLSKEVNTPYSDFGAIERGDTLYYSSYRFTNENDDYSPARPVTKVLYSVEGTKGRVISGGFNNKEKHTAHTAFNRAGDRMYFTICEYSSAIDIRCDLYYRYKIDKASWSKPIKLPDFINVALSSTTQPNVGYDEAKEQEILYFVSDRAEGKGGKDIWYSTIQLDGTFATPKNLAAHNTSFDDITPFYHEGTNTLYFSSNGHQNLGGFDIYKSTKIGEEWSTIQALDFPINSSFNDLYYTLNEAGTKAHFSSNRIGSAYIEAEKEACCNDIYSVEIDAVIIDLLASTFDSVSLNPLVGVEMRLQEIGKGEPLLQFNDKTHEFKYLLEPNSKYELIAIKSGFTSDTLLLSTEEIVKSEQLEEKFYLKELPPPPPAMVSLEALVFDTDEKELEGVRVDLVEKESEEKETKRNPASNEFEFELSPEKSYWVIAQKDGYERDTIEIQPNSLKLESTIQEKLFLKAFPVIEEPIISEPVIAVTPPTEKESTTSETVSVSTPAPVTKLTLDGYLPLPLYFDNDQPDSKTRRITTLKTYRQSYEAYYARKPIYLNEYSKGLLGEQRVNAETKIHDFFDDEVKAGAETLDGFTGQLLLYLEQGNSAEILVKGFASPRAQSDYNEALTKRRISSVRNHFQQWRNGALLPYLNNRQLVVTEMSFGENQSTTGVSDNIADRKNSIYSVSASKERRVEIIEIKTN